MDPDREIESMQADEAVDRLNRLSAERREAFNNRGVILDPAPQEEVTERVLKDFKDGDLAIRSRITSRLNRFAKDNLVGYAGEMAVLAVRRQSSVLVSEGLTALATEAGTGSDWRDSMVRLALLYHSAVKLGIDAQSAFEQAAALTVNDFAEAIRQFPLRPPEKLDLEVWGRKEVMTKDGFDYR